MIIKILMNKYFIILKHWRKIFHMINMKYWVYGIIYFMEFNITNL